MTRPSRGLTLVIAGCARGADTLAEEWAKAQDLPCEVFQADWARPAKSINGKRVAVAFDAALEAFLAGGNREGLLRAAAIVIRLRIATDP